MSAFRASTVSLDDSAGAPWKIHAEAVGAALHELSERLTAANNYVAASHKLLELEHAELGKALTQLQRAGDILNCLRKLLQEDVS